MFGDNCTRILKFREKVEDEEVFLQEKKDLLSPVLDKDARFHPLSLVHVGKISFAPALEGLRGLAVMLVMISHVLPGKEMLGTLGVGIFFVLSGFLITGVLVGSLVSTIFSKFFNP